MGTRRDRIGAVGRWMPVAAVLAALSTVLAALSTQGVGSAGAEPTVKVVVHVNFAQTTHERAGLENVTDMLEAARAAGLEADIEVVCHGDGIRLVEKARTELAAEVAALAAQGVRFVACQNTLRKRSLRPEHLLPGVATVPSGAYELVARQQAGYAYFKP